MTKSILPITLLLALFWPAQPQAVVAGVLVMALGDGFAGLLGPLISYYEVLHKEYPFFLNNGFFDKLAGTDQLRKQIESGQNEGEIRASWQPALQAFARQRKPYLLYPE